MSRSHFGRIDIAVANPASNPVTIHVALLNSGEYCRKIVRCGASVPSPTYYLQDNQADGRGLNGNNGQPRSKQSKSRSSLSRPKILSKCRRVYSAVNVAAIICHGVNRSIIRRHIIRTLPLKSE